MNTGTAISGCGIDLRPALRFSVWGVGLGIRGLGLGVWVRGFKVYGLGFGVEG
jgi:hypothetical protein